MRLINSLHNIFGRQSEKLALKYMQLQKFKLVKQNFRSPVGEIDLIMKKDSLLVFIEVRSRSNVNFMHPIESITENKVSHIKRAAEHFLTQKKYADMDVRFDLITISGEDPGSQLEHLAGFI